MIEMWRTEGFRGVRCSWWEPWRWYYRWDGRWRLTAFHVQRGWSLWIGPIIISNVYAERL